jgi:hypothetical protein
MLSRARRVACAGAVCPPALRIIAASNARFHVSKGLISLFVKDQYIIPPNSRPRNCSGVIRGSAHETGSDVSGCVLQQGEGRTTNGSASSSKSFVPLDNISNAWW